VEFYFILEAQVPDLICIVKPKIEDFRMHKFFLRFVLALPLLASLFCFADECTICNENPSRTNNTLSPVIRLVGTPCALTENIGMSLLGEWGTKNYRVGGTIGGAFGPATSQSRVKLSGEYLSQKLGYKFYSGNQQRWVNQYAIGAEYQYLIPTCFEWSSWISSIDVDLTYSHAFNRKLKSVICAEITESQLLPTLNRNIAGGNNAHLDFGATLLPWSCGKLFVGVDYDYTSYHRKYQHNVRSSGVGGTAWLYQKLGNSFDVNFGAEFRRPFNYYAAELKWNTPFNQGNLSLGVFASYTRGRDLVPNNTMAGISIELTFGGAPLFNSNGCGRCSYDCFCATQNDCLCDSQLLAWIARPAVYMPTVLAITDQAFVYNPAPPNPDCPICPVCPPCIPPTSTPFTGPGSSEETAINLSLFELNVSSNFSGSNLVYSISPANTGIAIDPTTGELIAPPSGFTEITKFTITATNSCGTTSQTIWLFNIAA
jgi:hypothetical protein